MTTNEAAERVLHMYGAATHHDASWARKDFALVVEEALAEERRATVERIRTALADIPSPLIRSEVHAILDAEAAR